VVERAVDPNTAHRREPLVQKCLCIHDRFKHASWGRLPELRQRVTVIAATIGQVRVAIDEAREYRHPGKIDDLRSRGNGEAFADGVDLVIADENDLIVERGTRIRIDQAAGSDGSDLGESKGGAEGNAEKAGKRSAHVVTPSVNKSRFLASLGNDKNVKAQLDGRGRPSSTEKTISLRRRKLAPCHLSDRPPKGDGTNALLPHGARRASPRRTPAILARAAPPRRYRNLPAERDHTRQHSGGGTRAYSRSRRPGRERQLGVAGR